MEQTPTHGAPRPIVFQDGLGQRRRLVDATGIERLEVLCLRSELTRSESFEAALRERAHRLAGFRHGYFAGVRTVDRLHDPAATLVVVSEAVPGVRLSDLLAAAERHGLVLDSGAAWYLVRQLVYAVATFHRLAPDVAHGALAPERIVIKPDARLAIVEHVMGSALERVRYSQERCWKELRIACPPSTGLARLDQRTDVLQVGIVALSLILGRALRDDEYPSAIEDVARSGWAASAARDRESVPVGFQSWLARALQFDSRAAFASAVEASTEFDLILGESGYLLAPAELERFLSRCREGTEPPPRAADTHGERPGESPRAAETPAPKLPALAYESIEPIPEVERSDSQPVPRTTGGDDGEEEGEDEDRDAPDESWQGGRWRRAAVAVVLLAAVAGAGAAGARRYFVVPARRVSTGTRTRVVDTSASAKSPSIESQPGPPAFGTPQVHTEPPGARVTVDGLTRGVVPESAPAPGWVAVSAPQDVQLYEGGRLLGTSQEPRIEMTPGTHQIDLVNEAVGYRGSRVVEVVKGKGQSITVEFPAGSIALNAIPWAEVWIDGEKVGETPIGNVPVSVGPHDIVFRNPDLGERSERAVVTLAAPVRLSVDLRKP